MACAAGHQTWRSREEEEISRNMFTHTIHGRWDKVQEIYEHYPEAYNTKITKHGDTALHIAVQDGGDEVVVKLVDIIFASDTDEQHKIGSLRVHNNRGETPLHLAASQGSVTMCRAIATKSQELVVSSRNNEGETPLFVAALNGNKEAFLDLHSLIVQHHGRAYCKRTNGDTILHCALDGEYFDLAFQIIHLYGDLGNCVNEQGFTPLHLLARMRKAFESGHYMGIIDQIIYNCSSASLLRVDYYVETSIHRYSRHSPHSENTTFTGFRENYHTVHITGEEEENQAYKVHFFNFLKVVAKSAMRGVGCKKRMLMIQEIKQTHTKSLQIMEELLQQSSEYEYKEHSELQPSSELSPDKSEYQEGKPKSSSSNGTAKKLHEVAINDKRETPLLIAAKNGITEMVESILKRFPLAINDVNTDGKNVVLLAVEYREVPMYKLLLRLFKKNDGAFRKVDGEGNGALHLAASRDHGRWLVPGAALQLHKQYMWYEYVKRSKPSDFFPKYNKGGKTALAVLRESNKELVDAANKWLSNTAQGCSVVVVLVATIAYTTSATIPGGFKGGDSGRDGGLPVLGQRAMFDVFAIAGDVAFVLSVMALVLFLPVFSSYDEVSHFRRAVPAKLLVGLTLLLLSLTAIMISFSAAESFIVVNDDLKYLKFLLFAATCFPVMLVANQFPLYFNILKILVETAFA